MTTYSTTHEGIERIVSGTQHLLQLLRRALLRLENGLAGALTSWQAIQQVRADARARQLMLQLAERDPRLAADFRAAVLRAERSDDRS